MSQRIVDSLLQHMTPSGLCRDVGNAYNVLSQAAVQKDIDAAKEIVRRWGDAPLHTYRLYFQKYGDDVAEAVARASNQASVAAFDRLIADVNARLQEAAANRNFDQLRRWCMALNAVVEGNGTGH